MLFFWKSHFKVLGVMEKFSQSNSSVNKKSTIQMNGK
nr:MAG TPA: hypothetical protein [Caudoviricetes sp.]